MTDTNRQIRKVWEEVASSPVPMAVFVFDHGLERFPVIAENEMQMRQVQKTLKDFGKNLVGIYDSQIDFLTLIEDIAFARNNL